MPTITLENVSKYYKNKRRSGAGNRREVGVENINLTIRQGEFVFITGSSGAGKSTLLDVISGRLKPDRGRVLLDGVNTARMLPWLFLFNRFNRQICWNFLLNNEKQLPDNQSKLI